MERWDLNIAHVDDPGALVGRRVLLDGEPVGVVVRHLGKLPYMVYPLDAFEIETTTEAMGQAVAVEGVE